jgi:GTPase SAR1 family protein
MSIISKKICIIGDSRVNPNSLIHHSVDYQLGVQYLSTVGVTISRKILDLPGVKPPNNLKLQLIIWNIAGDTKYKAIAPSYLRGSSGAIVVADFSCPETIERLPEHIQLFSSVNPKGFIIVALNKSDSITQEKLVQIKDLDGMSGIYLTSVNIGLYRDKIFQKIADKLLEPCDNFSPLVQPYPEIEHSYDRRGGGEIEI